MSRVSLRRTGDFVNRLARVAYAFLVLNYAAVAGTVAALTGKRVWR
jgi:hypothetical protein